MKRQQKYQEDLQRKYQRQQQQQLRQRHHQQRQNRLFILYEPVTRKQHIAMNKQNTQTMLLKQPHALLFVIVPLAIPLIVIIHLYFFLDFHFVVRRFMTFWGFFITIRK